MSVPVRFALGAAFVLAGWLLTRASARAWRPARPWAWAFDLFIAAVMFAAVLAATLRPVSAGLLAGSGLVAVAGIDLAKRRFLGEPVVFTDLGVIPELVRHSELYIAFVGYGKAIGAVVLVFGGFGAMLWLEPPLAPWGWAQGLLAALGVAALLVFGAGPPLPMLASALRRFQVSGDPVRDSSELGLAGMQFIHGVVTRADRPARRARMAPPGAPGAPVAPARTPVILVQMESFFDPARLDPALALPAWERLGAQAAARGRLAVPGVGGNTMRTEFEVLSGRPAADLGLDRLHPYQALCRSPVDSLAWRLKARGYRTVCLHPYDRRFYGRDKALPNLGFDRFLGAEAFAGATRSGLYVSDVAVADLAARIVEEEGPGVFLFLITMGAHGPWRSEPAVRLPDLPAAAAVGLGDWRARLDDMGAALESLRGLVDRAGGGVLAGYGDHLPSLPALWDARPGEDRRTDYLLWRAGGAAAPARQDLHAHDLAGRLLDLEAQAR